VASSISKIKAQLFYSSGVISKELLFEY